MASGTIEQGINPLCLNTFCFTTEPSACTVSILTRSLYEAIGKKPLSEQAVFTAVWKNGAPPVKA